MHVVYTCMMSECMCAVVHTEDRGTCKVSLSLSCSLQTVFLFEPEPNISRVLASKPQQTSCLCPHFWGDRHIWPYPAFTWMLGWVPCWATSPVLQCWFWSLKVGSARFHYWEVPIFTFVIKQLYLESSSKVLFLILTSIFFLVFQIAVCQLYWVTQLFRHYIAVTVFCTFS